MAHDIDTDLPGRLLAQGRPFEEVMAALEELLQQAHAARNYGAIVLLEGSRVTVLAHYGRPAADLALALDNYLSMQPDAIACASKILVAAVSCPELVARYIPPAIAALSDLPEQPNVVALLDRLREVESAAAS